jgi:agmatine deiminase
MFWELMKRKQTPDATASSIPPLPDLANKILTMPPEDGPHEGTWLQWPHSHIRRLRKQSVLVKYEKPWLTMSKALHTGEKVHIIVYDEAHRQRVQDMLEIEKCNMNQIDFCIIPTDDVWCRDNGPVFVLDEQKKLHITDWGFNGWGRRYEYQLSNQVPNRVAELYNLPVTTIPMINEGGSIEVDGCGTLMAKRSSILNQNRNKGWTQSDAEAYFRLYLGVTNFIWLDGKPGLDITDDHIDGTARFAHGKTIVTFYRHDFLDPKEYDQLKNATNANGDSYNIVHLPLTKRKVMGEYGFYINFYVGNQVVLMPSFDDPNDQVARDVLQELYTDRRVVMIPMLQVFKDGGMMHCVTQQQPEISI